MSSVRIALLDSGLGGLPYHKESKRLLPEAAFFYVADRANYPYGELSTERLVAALVSLVERSLSRIGPDLIVLACNTASVTALEVVRRRYSVPFVGVVPAIKPAAAAGKGRNIGVLSTKATAKASYLNGLIKEHAQQCRVHVFPAGGLVDYVEELMPLDGSCPEHEELSKAVTMIRDAGVDQVVLGCTHFLHVKERLSRLIGEEVRIVDSAEGVARQIQRVAQSMGGSSTVAGGYPPGDMLFVTADGPWVPRYEEAAEAFGLSFSGVL